MKRSFFLTASKCFNTSKLSILQWIVRLGISVKGSSSLYLNRLIDPLPPPKSFSPFISSDGATLS